jgi:hypothetical protein
LGFFADHSADGEVPKSRLYFLDLDTPVYWTDFDIDIKTTGGVAGAHVWTAQPITPGPVSNQPDGASASFRIADSDNVIFPPLSTQNGGELAEAAIYEAGFLTTNETAVPDEVIQIFSGRVDRSTVNEDDSIEFVLMPPAQTDAAELPDRLVSTLVRDP